MHIMPCIFPSFNRSAAHLTAHNFPQIITLLTSHKSPICCLCRVCTHTYTAHCSVRYIDFALLALEIYVLFVSVIHENRINRPNHVYIALWLSSAMMFWIFISSHCAFASKSIAPCRKSKSFYIVYRCCACSMRNSINISCTQSSNPSAASGCRANRENRLRRYGKLTLTHTLFLCAQLTPIPRTSVRIVHRLAYIDVFHFGETGCFRGLVCCLSAWRRFTKRYIVHRLAKSQTWDWFRECFGR